MAHLKVYGGVEGPLGLPMPEAIAKDVEGLLKGLSADCRALVEKAGGPLRMKRTPDKFELLPGERADVSLITTDSVDRDREVVLPGGGDWRSFLKGGGPVTWAHNYDQLPVGRALWLKRVEEPANGWLAKTKYTPRPDDWRGDWFPDAVLHFVQDGMRGKSIGFIPTELGPPQEKEIAARPELAGVRCLIRKWVGLEYAVAPIQSNPDAVAVGVSKARAKGLVVPQFMLDSFGVYVPDGPEATGILVKDGEAAQTKPKPAEGESREDFMSRCMAYPDLQDKPQDERAGLCNGIWEQAHPAKAVAPAPLKVIPPELAAGSRTPREIEAELEQAALDAVNSLDLDKIAEDTIDRMRGRV